MKVYVVTDGYYSDMHIVGVFSTADKAKAYADTFDDQRIHEWDVDGKKSCERVKRWVVTINADTGDECTEPDSYWVENTPELRSVPDIHDNVIRVWSDESLEHARKLAAEWRQHQLRTKQR